MRLVNIELQCSFQVALQRWRLSVYALTETVTETVYALTETASAPVMQRCAAAQCGQGGAVQARHSGRTFEWPYSSPMANMGTPCASSSAAARLRTCTATGPVG